MNIFEYIISIWGIYFLINKTKVGEWIYNNIDITNHPKINFALQCPFCLAFWTSLILVIIGAVPLYSLLIVAPSTQILSKFYDFIDRG